MCLTAAGDGSANGTPLQMAAPRGDLDQPWHVSFRRYLSL
jgi:hypothetical protein